MKAPRDTEVASGPSGNITTANQTGVPITFLGADEEGDGLLNFGDSAGERRLSLEIGVGGGRLRAFNEGGTEAIVIGADSLGHGILNAYGADGALDASLNKGVLDLYGQGGSSTISLRTDDNGGRIWLNNHDGSVKTSVGLDADGGSILLWDNPDNLVVHLAALSTGGGYVAVGGSQVHDVAEVFDLDTRDGVIPGTVMSIDALGGGGLKPSVTPYDRKVVGVISGAGDLRHAMLIGTREDGSQDLPVALSGQVYVRISAENGAISPGDLLVSSSTAGVAMAATDIERSIGAVVGKALQAFAGDDSEGLIRMLVMVR